MYRFPQQTRNLVAVTCLAALLSLAACEQGREDTGFSLPEGNVDSGKKVFVEMQCNACHSTVDVAKLSESDSGISVRLGGEVRRIKTYSELVTAVINPSHKILQGFAPQHSAADGKSAMRNYNDVLTVSQLSDLVSYLQTQYKLEPFQRSQYRAYFPE